jgi:hypothetical protein
LPGEVDAPQYTQVLTLGMNAQRPVKAVVADARRGGARLTPNDWKLLAFYSWGTDEQQVAPKDGAAELLKRLAAACPADQPETATRLLLQWAAALGSEKSAAAPDAAARERVLQVLADPAAARTHMDLLTFSAADIVHALSGPASAARSELVQAFDAALKKLQDDSALSRADRVAALSGRIDLARLDKPKAAALPDALRADAREQATRFDREITDGYERQAVITEAAYVLQQAGLLDESDALLKANLTKSHAAYYLMSELGSNARERGDTAAALNWYEQAFVKAEGPATRLQWGASYVSALVDLAPQDESRIEHAALQLLDEAAGQPNAFYERSARSLQRAADKLLAWNKGRAHAAAIARLKTRLEGVCAALPADDPAQRKTCTALLDKPSTAAAPRPT